MLKIALTVLVIIVCGILVLWAMIGVRMYRQMRERFNARYRR